MMLILKNVKKIKKESLYNFESVSAEKFNFVTIFLLDFRKIFRL